MKAIMCATDFSRASGKVCKYAAQLAKQTQSKLTLLYASHPAMSYSPVMQSISLDAASLTGFYQNKLLNLARELEQFVDGGIEIETFLKEGHVAEVITTTAEELKPNILIMGTIGKQPLRAELFGNTTTEMIKKSPVPLMLVPPKAQFKSYENVYVAIDINEKIDMAAFKKMIDSLEPFKVIITIFSVVQNPKSEYVKTAIQQIKELLKGHPHVIDIIKGNYFVELFLSHAQLYRADLMIVFPKHHNFLQRWFIHSGTEELNFKVDLPLMAIS